MMTHKEHPFCWYQALNLIFYHALLLGFLFRECKFMLEQMYR
jgi:hypothetical protein